MASHEEVPTEESMAPPVIISFAAGDAETVREAAAALEARGHGVTLVEGVDTDPDSLTAAIGRHSAQGLYVLCRSAALTRDTIDELRSLLRSHGVPFGRTLTLALEARRARALEERIVSVLRRMITGRGALPRPVVPVATPPPEPDEETDTMIRPPGDSGRIPVGAAAIPPPPLDQEDIAAWADSLVGQPAASRAEMGRSGPWPTLEQSPSPIATDPNASTSRIEPGQFEAITADLAARGNTAISPLPKPPEVPTIPDVPSPPRAAAPQRSPIPSAPPPAPGPTLDSSLSRPPAPSADELDDEDYDVAGGRFSQALGGAKGLALVAGGVLAVALIIVAAVAFSGDDKAKKPEVAKADKADDPSSASKAESGKDAEPGKDAPAASNADGDAPANEAAADDGPAEAADDADAAADGEAPEPEPAKTEAAVAKTEPPKAAPPKAEPPKADPPKAAPKPEPAPTPPPAPEPEPRAKAAEPTSADAGAIARALRDREVRALDVFIVSPESKKASDHAGAVAYCESLVVAEIDGWRLPQIGELNSLGAAKLVRRDVFWSDTDGDTFGDTRLVLNARKDRIGAAPKTWSGAKAICIRKRS